MIFSSELVVFGAGGLILVIWSCFSTRGAGGTPIIGLAITVQPRGIGLAINMLTLLSSEGNGPVIYVLVLII